MVKGTTRQVMMVRLADTDLFEQAIFLLKEDSLEKQGITERQILEEAKRLAEGCAEQSRRRKHRLSLSTLAWSSAGAALTGLVWLITTLLS